MRTSSETKKRNPGRPSENEAIKERMLEIAMNEFAAHGFRGVSVTTIAREAGVTSAMIHYYFGNKQGLYEAVLAHALGPLLAQLNATIAEPPGKQDMLPHFLRSYMRLLAENPQVPSLIVRDVLTPDGEMRDLFLQDFAGRGGRGLRELVIRAQTLGTLKPELDPDLTALSLLSMAVFPFVGRPVAGQVLSYSLDPKAIDSLAAHTLTLFYQGAGV